MNPDYFEDQYAEQVRTLAQHFPYPATPRIAVQVIPRLRGVERAPRTSFTPRWVWIAALIVILFTGLMAVPSVRAAVLEFLQIGVIRISTEDATPPLPTPLPSGTPQPIPTPLTLNSYLELYGETTLETARAQIPAPIQLPTYSQELGDPDKVFYQNLDRGWGLFLIWLAPDDPDRLHLSLLILSPNAFAGKGAPSKVTETTVNGVRALYTEGDHFLVLQTAKGELDLVQFFVQGHVLIWAVDGLTYRLESQLTMDEMIKIAESLR